MAAGRAASRALNSRLLPLVVRELPAPSASPCQCIDRQLSSRAASTSSGSRSGGGWGWAPWLPASMLPFLVASASLADSEQATPEDAEGFHLLPLSSRQRVFFKYEKRVRDRSALDKVFDYFSSVERDGLKYMVDVDLLHAMVPTYPPSEARFDRSGALDGERKKKWSFWSKAQTGFFSQFDVDGDGLVSYPEFLLVLTLASIPERDVHTIFEVVDLDDNGVIDVEEFKAVVQLLQSMANVHTASVGRSHKLSLGSDSGILLSFFGKDGSKKLRVTEFSAFLARLHEELIRLEFVHYDVGGRGSLSPLDFAHSLLATADLRQVDKLLDKAETMDGAMLQKRISFEDFAKFYHISRNLRPLKVALDFLQQIERPVTKVDFDKLLKKLTGISLSSQAVDVAFHVFGDEHGHLNIATFLDVMNRREVMWVRRGMAIRIKGSRDR